MYSKYSAGARDIMVMLRGGIVMFMRAPDEKCGCMSGDWRMMRRVTAGCDRDDVRQMAEAAGRAYRHQYRFGESGYRLHWLSITRYPRTWGSHIYYLRRKSTFRRIRNGI